MPVFVRGPRLPAPPVPSREAVVRAPIQVPRLAPVSPVARLLPLTMACATVAVIVFGFTTGSPLTKNPMFVLWPAMMLVSAVAMLVQGGGARSRTAEVNENRKDFLRHLARVGETVAEAAAAQRVSALWRHPDPDALWTLVGTARMWERRTDDPDFGHVRLGIGRQPLATALHAADVESAEEREPVTAAAARRFIRTHSTVDGMPIVLPLATFPNVTLDGEAAAVRALVRAMVCHLAVLHAPSALRVAAVVGRDAQNHWEWLKWLPHNQHPTAVDATGPARLFYRSLGEARESLVALSPHVVVVVDGSGGTATLEFTTGRPEAASRPDLRLTVTTDCVSASDGADLCGRPDAMSTEHALTCARLLAPYRDGGNRPIDADVAWRHGDDEARLRVPVGTTPEGTPVELDLKESAEGGVGPHGLCVGATGSGKSELLRTLTLGLVRRHPPDVVNLVLVDFKGGATFLGFESAPHVAAVITNLADEAHLVARMRDALAGEVHRRQQMLRAAGTFTNVSEYERARRSGAALAPLPALLVVVDEFTELLSQHPDFAELFVGIGRVGRSLRIHLLLASQRLDEARLRGLESHLSYRICLKTFSEGESRALIGAPDAFHLPNRPGAAYLQAGPGRPALFRTAYVSGPCRPAPLRAELRPQRFTALSVGTACLDSAESTSGGPSVLETVLNRVCALGGAPAHPIWLPPLDESPRLGSLLAESPTAERLSAPVGVVDSPYEHRRDPFLVKLSGSTGNIVIVGGPQSGKSATMSTVMTALALTHGPDRVQFYCLDFGGGALARLASLPHVGAVAARTDGELLRRTVAQLMSLMRDRERMLQQDKVAWAADVFLLVDGWSTLRREYESLESPITELATRGLSYGIHVAVTASRWAELRPALRDQLGTRIELRLGDAGDSELNRKAAQHVPENRPGRGITREGKHMAIAAPGDATDVVAALRLRYGEHRAPAVRLLPKLVEREAIADTAGTPIVGIDEDGLGPVCLDFDNQPHLLILGDTRCGKTATLRLLCRELMRTTAPGQAQVFVVDYRRTLLGVVDSDHLAGYAPSDAALAVHLPGLLAELRARLPGPDVSAQQLRTRSWWSGPQLYLIADDYDLVGAEGNNPLTSLLEYLPYATDIGLHLIVARRAGGAVRAMFEPLLARMRHLGCQGLVMSASPEEGAVFGTARPSPLPPGRGTLVSHSGECVIQVAWTQP